jgi:hypothetical protein
MHQKSRRSQTRGAHTFWAEQPQLQRLARAGELLLLLRVLRAVLLLLPRAQRLLAAQEGLVGVEGCAVVRDERAQHTRQAGRLGGTGMGVWRARPRRARV